jgi:hypothetical protein
MEKVRPQFLSLRHSSNPRDFSMKEWAENLPIKWSFRELQLYLRLRNYVILGPETAFFSKASYFVILVQFRKVKRQSNNLQRKILGVRISLGRASATRLEPPGQFFQKHFVCMSAFWIQADIRGSNEDVRF